MILVLDASAAISIALKRREGVRVLDALIHSDKVIAPALYRIETANALWKYVRANMLTQNEANDLFNLIVELPDELIDTHSDAVEALNEGIRLGHSAYDMLYLNLTRRFGAILATIDQKLLSLARREKLRTLCQGDV